MEEKVIVVATDLEEGLVKNLTKLKIIKTQPGSSNVIETLKNLDKRTKIINVGYAGSNILPVGSIVKVKDSYLYHPNVTFKEKSYNLGGEVDCYTSNDFVLQTTLQQPVVFDMELNTICALGFDVVSYKIVSDNLSLKQYEEVDLNKKWLELFKLIGE
ncbi:MAG: hypothetical protein IJW32_06130 [Clostridia bacterium]|nr:hypothetical protein [Clostridia bacterium]MBQ9793292.1 hypothetical protein [Clostridia bacterium]